VWEIDSSSGTLVRRLYSAPSRLLIPNAMVASGPDLFVANAHVGTASESRESSVVELNATSGAVVRVISGSEYRFGFIVAMAVTGKDLFVASSFVGQSVTEINLSTGVLVRVYSAPRYGFDGPSAMVGVITKTCGSPI
jgi:hypothetical protein